MIGIGGGIEIGRQRRMAKMKKTTLISVVLLMLVHRISSQNDAVAKELADNALKQEISPQVQAAPKKAKPAKKAVEAETKGDEDKSLFRNPACAKDFLAVPACKTVLKTGRQGDDVAAILCLTSPDPNTHKPVKISNECQHEIWQKKLEITGDERILQTLSSACKNHTNKLERCLREKTTSESSKGNAKILGCLYEQFTATDQEKLMATCSKALNDIERIVFSDYRLIGDFAYECQTDIDRLKCGRVDTHAAFGNYTSQDFVITCLENDIKGLGKKCKKQLFKVIEWQSEDYHLDLQLFIGCQSDRWELCGKVQSGQGRIYDCLMEKRVTDGKKNEKMSRACMKELKRRIGLLSADAKASRSFINACAPVISASDECSFGKDLAEHPQLKLNEILLCLEGEKMRNPGSVTGECRESMDKHRKFIMESYKMSPEVMSECKDAIEFQCLPMDHKEEDVIAPGQVLHCLMNLAKSDIANPKCVTAVENVVKASGVGSNWKIDPVLESKCKTVVMRTECSGLSEPGSVLDCLFDLVAHRSKKMTHDCGEALMEVQYFLSRDFALTPLLYKKCKNDAQQFCGADFMGESYGKKMLFSCLVRMKYGQFESPEQLEDGCKEEIDRVLEQRAISVKMHPEIEGNCRSDIAAVCEETNQPGAELQCLQENYKMLSTDCQQSVKEYSMAEAKNTRLNTPILRHCERSIKSNCKAKDPDDIMDCLVDLKTKKELNDECLTAVTKWQMFKMQDIDFAPKFKQACGLTVMDFCGDVTSTRQAVKCLSKILQEDLRAGAEKSRIAPLCRKRLEMRMRAIHSDIKLSPKLLQNCHDELEQYCSGRKSLSCLESRPHSDLSPRCREMVFEKEKEQIIIDSTDVELNAACGREINTHCARVSQTAAGILSCLKENMNAPNFDSKCYGVVKRKIVVQSKDYRLNPVLQKRCAEDLPKHCNNIIERDSGNHLESDFMEGKVIKCLMDAVLKDKKSVSRPCRYQLDRIVKQEMVDIKAHPGLVKACPNAIRICTVSKPLTLAQSGGNSDNGKIEECLKNLLSKGKLLESGDGRECEKEVATLVEKEAAMLDVSSDKVLFDACSMDLGKFCRNIPEGEGRQIACLKEIYTSPNMVLEQSCEVALSSRLKLYTLSLEVSPVQSIQELYYQVSGSPVRHYILLGVFWVLAAIFLIGIVCGRKTRRQFVEMKTR